MLVQIIFGTLQNVHFQRVPVHFSSSSKYALKVVILYYNIRLQITILKALCFGFKGYVMAKNKYHISLYVKSAYFQSADSS